MLKVYTPSWIVGCLRQGRFIFGPLAPGSVCFGWFAISWCVLLQTMDCPSARFRLAFQLIISIDNVSPHTCTAGDHKTAPEGAYFWSTSHRRAFPLNHTFPAGSPDASKAAIRRDTTRSNVNKLRSAKKEAAVISAKYIWSSLSLTLRR